jgi:hypothetical protein
MASNAYGLPDAELETIRARDQACVYCHTVMTPYGSESPSTGWATIEHMNHLPPWDDPTTVAICCSACNSSRGAKLLPDWFETDYCRSRGIDESTVAEPVRDFIRTASLE